MFFRDVSKAVGSISGGTSTNSVSSPPATILTPTILANDSPSEPSFSVKAAPASPPNTANTVTTSSAEDTPSAPPTTAAISVVEKTVEDTQEQVKELAVVATEQHDSEETTAPALVVEGLVAGEPEPSSVDNADSAAIPTEPVAEQVSEAAEVAVEEAGPDPEEPKQPSFEEVVETTTMGLVEDVAVVMADTADIPVGESVAVMQEAVTTTAAAQKSVKKDMTEYMESLLSRYIFVTEEQENQVRSEFTRLVAAYEEESGRLMDSKLEGVASALRQEFVGEVARLVPQVLEAQKVRLMAAVEAEVASRVAEVSRELEAKYQQQAEERAKELSALKVQALAVQQLLTVKSQHEQNSQKVHKMSSALLGMDAVLRRKEALGSAWELLTALGKSDQVIATAVSAIPSSVVASGVDSHAALKSVALPPFLPLIFSLS